MKFREGQHVRVEFEGIVRPDTDQTRQTHFTRIEDEHGIIHHVWATTVTGRSVITAAEPAYWPPQIGDLWITDAGHEYMIREGGSQSSSTGYGTGYGIVSRLDAHAPTLRGRYDELKAANPTLARRRGVDL